MKRGGLIALIVFLVLLLIGLALTIAYAFFRPIIKPEARYRLVTYPPGDNFELQQNTTFEIFCDYAEHNPTEVTQIEWSSRDYPIGRNPYVQNFRNLSSKLIFVNGSSYMNGRYTCKGSQQRYERQRDITIKFRDFSPVFDQLYEYVEAYEGSNAILNCRAQSNDKLSYRWFFNNELNPISSSDNVYIVDAYEASSLHIDNVQTSHDGRYTCNATNNYGTSSKVFILTVIHGGGPPKFLEKYTEITAELNSRVEVHAAAEGERPLDYIWYNQDEEIISSDESSPVYYILSDKGEATVLVFTNFQESETGPYTCAAKNSYGLATKVFQLVADTGKAPKFLTDHQNVTFEKGSKVELLCCDSHEAKNVTYQWINQHGEEVSENTTFPVHETITEKGSVLTIKALESNDSEVYSCYAWNDYGLAFTEFEIQLKPIFESAPSFKETYEVVLAKEGTKLEVTCTASGDTPIEYTWYNQDSDLIGKDDTLAIYVTDSDEGSKLTIKEVKKSDSGTYTCNAKNNEGLHSKVFNIEVYPAPDENDDETSIHFAKVVNATVDSILFAIATHESVESIEIAYNETWRGTLKTKTFKKGDPYEIKDLIPAAVYNISFRVSAPKSGSWSDVYTVPLFPRKPELIFRTLREDMLVVDLATTVDERMRRAIDRYELTYRTVYIQNGSIWEPNACAVTFVKPACTGSRFTIAALMRKVYYELSVRGHTEAGYGEPYTQKFYLK